MIYSCGKRVVSGLDKINIMSSVQKLLVPLYNQIGGPATLAGHSMVDM
jgi:hypothetical protein